MTDASRRTLGAGLLGTIALGIGAAHAQTAPARGPAPDPARLLSGRVALVTGAARGIGLACALELARHGADLALLDIADPQGVPGVGSYPLASREDLAAAEQQIRALGARALAVRADIRDLATMERATERIGAELGGIDIVVANAGVYPAGDTLAGFAADAARAVLDTNLLGTIHTVKAALPGLRRRGGGRIIVTTSFLGRVGGVDSLVYGASKWALNGLTKNMARELGPEGITVNAVAPGIVDTLLYAKGRDRDAALAAARELQGTVLPGGALEPVEIARAVAFLAGPGGDHVSGTILDVNNGRSAANTA